jgi:hypothetical protein
MKTFTERLNATLPMDEPDGVLLAMVQGEPDRVCGKPCPPGQGPSEDGRCLPDAILAKAARKPWPAPVAAQVPASGLPAGSKPVAAITGWSATVTAARPAAPAVGRPLGPPPQPPAPAVAQTTAPTALSASTVPPPTEGRMALAGPALEATPPGTPEVAGQAAAPRLAPQTSPKRAGQGSYSWVRMMNEHRFDSPN